MDFTPGVLRIPGEIEFEYDKHRNYGDFVVVILYPPGHPCYPYEKDGWFDSIADAENDIASRVRVFATGYVIGIFFRV